MREEHSDRNVPPHSWSCRARTFKRRSSTFPPPEVNGSGIGRVAFLHRKPKILSRRFGNTHARGLVIPVSNLTIPELDRLSVLIRAGRGVGSANFVTMDLAPYLEWYWLRSAGHRLGMLTHTPPFEDFHLQLKSRQEIWFSGDSQAMGFIKILRIHTDSEHLAWVQFRFELQRAMIRSGFDEKWAKQMVGAIGELEDNIHTHSHAVQTGLIAYGVRDESVELIVMDRGIGVLASLRQGRDFGALEDHGVALQIALGDGNSRYGNSGGRGWGFHELLVGLANSSAHLRFRSGDHLLSIEGDTPELAAAVLRQQAFGNGLFVAVRAKAS